MAKAKQKTLDAKRVVIDEIGKKLEGAKAVVLADHRGLTVAQDTELRNALRAAGIEYKVVKNTLTRFAVKEKGLDALEEYLVGPTAMATHDSDPVAPAKVLSEYAKKFDKLDIKAGVVEGRVIDINGVKSLADLPSKEVLVARALGGLNAPITGFVYVLSANISGLARVLNAVTEKRQQESA